MQKYYLPQRHDTNWRIVSPNTAPLTENEPQSEETYWSSEDEDEIAENSSTNVDVKDEYSNKHATRNENSGNRNRRTHEKDENKVHASSEDRPPDSEDGATQGSLLNNYIRCKLRPGKTSYILKSKRYEEYADVN